MFDNRHLGIIRSGSDEMNEIAAAPSPADLRAFIDNEIKSSDEVKNRQKTAEEFVAVYKPLGYKDNKANGNLMRHELQQRGHWSNPKIADFEEAFVALNESHLLELDQAKIQATQAAELDARANEIRANRFDEDKAYGMTADQLRAKARGHEFENDPLCPSASRV